MNHKQISDLTVGDRLELIEDYIYNMEWGNTQIIRKGTRMTFINPVLGAWRFKFDKEQKGFFPINASFGRSRLLKLKVRLLEDKIK